MAARSRRLRGISLCAGLGGLDLGLEDALRRFGIQLEPVVYVEREIRAAEVLAARIAHGDLPAAPIWSDIVTFDARPGGKVPLVYGGVPCQPHSVAGKRKGVDDDRSLWPYVEAICTDCDADILFLENVDGLRTSSGGEGLGEVLEGLARLGLVRIRWLVLSAERIGAPHRRSRVFLIASRPLADLDVEGRRALESLGVSDDVPESWHNVDRRDGPVAHGNVKRLPRRKGLIRYDEQQFAALERDCIRLARGERWWPPGRLAHGAWADLLLERPDLAPTLPPAQPEVCRILDGATVQLEPAMRHRNSRLRGLGNLVLPPQAEQAAFVLFRSIGFREVELDG